MEPESLFAIDSIQPQAQHETGTPEYDGSPANMSPGGPETAARDDLEYDSIIKTAARNGLGYDNVKAQRDAPAGASPDRVYIDFIEEYPDVDPKSIPDEVWRQANREGSLLSAYRAYELKQYRARLAAVEQNEKNRRTCAGSVETAGSPPEPDPFLQGLFGR